MSFEAARADMVAAAQAALATWVGPPSPLLLSFENQGIVDQGTQFDPYLCVDMLLVSGEQLSMGATKAVATYGQIHLVTHTRENSGTLLGLKILDHFRPYFQMKAFSTIRTQAARPAGAYPVQGWLCQPLIVPFWYHDLVT